MTWGGGCSQHPHYRLWARPQDGSSDTEICPYGTALKFAWLCNGKDALPCITWIIYDNILKKRSIGVYRINAAPRISDMEVKKTSHLQWTYHFFDHMDGSKRWYADEHQHSCSYQILVNKCSMMFIPPRYGIIMHYIIGNYSVYFRIW